MKNKYFYFSKPHQLNDPFDMHTNNSYETTDNEIKQWLLEHNINESISEAKNKFKNEIFRQKLDEKAEKDKNNFNVLSLCDSPLNEILWGTYTDNYSGICLCYRAYQFDNELIENSNIYYIETLNHNSEFVIPSFREINKKNYFFIRPVKYDNDGTHQYHIFNHKRSMEEIEFNIFHKKDIWKPEQEYRAILLSHPLRPDYFNQKVFYGNETLCEVFF